MTPPELEFSDKEVFDAFQEAKLMTCPGTMDLSDAMTVELNRLLAEKIAKCPMFFIKQVVKDVFTSNSLIEADTPDKATHTAYLVGIAPIKGAADSESPIKEIKK